MKALFYLTLLLCLNFKVCNGQQENDAQQSTHQESAIINLASAVAYGVAEGVTGPLPYFALAVAKAAEKIEVLMNGIDALLKRRVEEEGLQIEDFQYAYIAGLVFTSAIFLDILAQIANKLIIKMLPPNMMLYASLLVIFAYLPLFQYVSAGLSPDKLHRRAASNEFVYGALTPIHSVTSAFTPINKKLNEFSAYYCPPKDRAALLAYSTGYIAAHGALIYLLKNIYAQYRPGTAANPKPIHPELRFARPAQIYLVAEIILQAFILIKSFLPDHLPSEAPTHYATEL